MSPHAKELPILFSAPMVRAILAGRKTQTRRVVKPRKFGGAPGDRLWVRETFYAFDTPTDPSRRIANYRADGVKSLKWTSPRFMPRALSRITLEIIAVRVERLQEISDLDAASEGLPEGPLQDHEPAGVFIGRRHHLSAVRLRYECLWDSINGEKHPWASNPLVRVITFRKL